MHQFQDVEITLYSITYIHCINKHQSIGYRGITFQRISMFHSIKPSWSSHFRLSWCVFFYTTGYWRTHPSNSHQIKSIKMKNTEMVPTVSIICCDWNKHWLCRQIAYIVTSALYSNISIRYTPTDFILCILHPQPTIFPLGSCAWMPASLLLWSNLPTQR